LAADRQPLPLVFYDSLLVGLEILLNIGPMKSVASRVETAIQLFLQDEGEETAEHMPPDRFTILRVFSGLLGIEANDVALLIHQDFLDLKWLLVFESGTLGADFAQGADVKLKDSKGNTALDYAKQQGHQEIVRMLTAPKSEKP
jgi:ankyrin repeat protein